MCPFYYPPPRFEARLAVEGRVFVGRGRLTMRLSTVSATNFMSGRFAPATPQPTGTPWPSVSRLRLTPLLARSVGLGPVFFPAQRGLRQGPIHPQPAPVQALQLLKLLYPGLPQLQKHSGLDP